MSSNVLVHRMVAWAGSLLVLSFAVSACQETPAESSNDDAGGTAGAGTGGTAGAVATGGAPQGGGGGAPNGGVGARGGASGAAPTGGISGQGGVGGAGPGGNENGATGGASGGGFGGSFGGSGGAGAPPDGAGAGGRGGGSGTGGTGGRPSFSGSLKIMPLGDSITQASCYRARLWQKLTQAGKTNFDFVGSQTSSGCGISGYDAQHEGHGGYLVTNLTGAMIGELRTWLTNNTPDLVLFHFGTNDAWNNIAPQTILNSFGVVVDELRARKPNVWVLVAQIIPMNPVNTASCMTCSCPACGGRVQTLNGMIPAWAASKSTAQSPVLVVDQWTGYDANADSNGDGVHPSETGGSEKMATRWFNALSPLF